MEKFETVRETPRNDEKAFATLLEKLAKEIENKSQKQEVIEAIGKLVSEVDQNVMFKIIRKAWDILPEQMQWLVLKGEAILVPGISFKAFNNLVQVGLLNYKGHENKEDKGIAIDEMAKDNREIFAKAAKIIVPSQKAVMPILSSLEKIDEAKLKIYAEVRKRKMKVVKFPQVDQVDEDEDNEMLKKAA